MSLKEGFEPGKGGRNHVAQRARGRAPVMATDGALALQIEPDLQIKAIAGGMLPIEAPTPIDPRSQAAAEWKRARAFTHQYSAGIAKDGRAYPAGQRLYVVRNGALEHVMDTCETPWAKATVDEMFRDFTYEPTPSGVPEILTAGYGLGITERLILQKLIGLGGGNLHIIELNSQIANAAVQWAGQIPSALNRLAHSDIGTRPNVNIEVHRGDVNEVIDRFLQEGRVFNRFFRDTYPLTENEQGINDLTKPEETREIITRKGRVSIFAHHPGSSGGLLGVQKDILSAHGLAYSVDAVDVVPADDYDYLQEPAGPVKVLPVVIAWKSNGVPTFFAA